MEKMQFLRPDSAKQLILLKKTSYASVSAVLGRCEVFLSNTINEQIPKGDQKDRDISSLWW